VWLYDLSWRTLTRFTFVGNYSQPVWTPDGKRIAFQSNKEGPLNVFWQMADGSGGLERLTTGEYLQAPHSWSTDGQVLAFVEIDPTTGIDIWVLRLGDRKAQPFLRTPFNEGKPRFSPDGCWLAYISDESGRYEIYVQPYPGPGGKWQISTEGGAEPMWNPNGRELFYCSGDKMMAVDIATQPSFSAGKPRAPDIRSPLFRVASAGGEPVAVTKLPAQLAFHRFPSFLPDGHHFLYFQTSGSSEASAGYVGSLDSNGSKRLLGADTDALFSVPGELLFLRQGTLLRRR
jgi:Tol biopolymer transport system component